MPRNTRVARPADASRLCDLQMDGWRAEYPHDVDPEVWLDADGFDRSAREANMVRLMSAPETQSFLVATQDGVIAGFITLGDSRDADRPGETELAWIYFDPRNFGSGLATELVEDALGDRPAYVWVAEKNRRAYAFYRKLGFTPDGTRRDTDTLFDQAEIRLAR
jgi:ribosomal protein S18 acetylase RimI-like enzyme